MGKVEQLMFRLSLIDKVTGPANRVTASIDKMYDHATAGSVKFAGGMMGLRGVTNTLNSFLDPAKEMSRALATVSSLFTSEPIEQTDKTLAKLTRTALSTSLQYGTSASSIVASSYDIQSAIAGLSGDELSAFTRASAILAKGTKADAAVMTDYMGTMYGIFKNTASNMGKTKWVEILTGQTANAVEMFKTNGTKMAASFGSLGADAQSAGVNMAEQMAVLGTLQATMSGSEAGTRYRAFLGGVGRAQESLNMQFTDGNGRMLGMVDILSKLKTRFGEIDTVAEADMLTTAFGGKDATALIKLLMQDTDGLASNINKLGNVSGMEKALKMAKSMIDPWERLAASGTAVKIVFGRVMQPVLIPLIERLTTGAETVMRWTELFPNLTRVVGTSILIIMGLIAVVSTFAIVGGIASLTVAGWHAFMAIGAGVMLAYRGAIMLVNGALGLFRAVALASALQFYALNGAVVLSTASTWLFSAALWANPLTWIVVGVVALIASLVALAYNWDTVSAAVSRFVSQAIEFFVQGWGWLRSTIEDNAFLSFAFAPLLAGLHIVDLLVDGFKKIPQWWQQFKSWLTALDPFAFIGNSIDWLIKKINLIPGINIAHDSDKLVANVQDVKKDIQLNSQNLIQPQKSIVPQGGLLQQVNNNNNGRATHIERVEVHSSQPIDGFSLVDELQMAGA